MGKKHAREETDNVVEEPAPLKQERKKKKKAKPVSSDEDDTVHETAHVKKSSGKRQTVEPARSPHDSSESEEDSDANPVNGSEPSLAGTVLGARRAIAKETTDGVSKPKDPAARKQEALPDWILNGKTIDESATLSVNSLGLHPPLEQALQTQGITSLFPVQDAAEAEWRSWWRCDRDICVCAPTGSGKTLAYAIPIVQTLMTRIVKRLRAVIVLPSRDLAMQVHSVVQSLCVGSDLVVRDFKIIVV